MNTGIYKTIVIAKNSLFKLNPNFVLIFKPSQIQPHFIFNNYFIHKDILVSYMEITIAIHGFLSVLSHQCLFLADIKHEY